MDRWMERGMGGWVQSFPHECASVFEATCQASCLQTASVLTRLGQ